VQLIRKLWMISVFQLRTAVTTLFIIIIDTIMIDPTPLYKYINIRIVIIILLYENSMLFTDYSEKIVCSRMKLFRIIIFFYSKYNYLE
jgi:hypothetical protein